MKIPNEHCIDMQYIYSCHISAIEKMFFITIPAILLILIFIILSTMTISCIFFIKTPFIGPSTLSEIFFYDMKNLFISNPVVSISSISLIVLMIILMMVFSFKKLKYKIK